MSKKAKSTTGIRKHTAPLSKEIQGIIFLLIAIILGVSLFSFHPGDPLVWTGTGNPGKAHNLFGTVGAHIGGGMVLLLGFSSIWLVALFITLSFLFFKEHIFTSPIMSIFSFSFLIFSFSGIMNLHLPGAIAFRGGEMISGGLAGLLIAGSMKGVLNFFGAYVLLLSIFIISLMICTRLSFGWIFSTIYLWFIGLIKGFQELHTKRAEKRRKGRVRKKTLKKEKGAPRRKVTIVEPRKEVSKKQEQETFPFMNVVGKFKLPSLDLLDAPPDIEGKTEIHRESLEMNARRLEKKLADFGVKGEVVEILPGPVITMYELKPAPGVKISKVAGLSDDLALALRAPSVRIVAPLPGKAAIGIEIPNNKRNHVYLKEILSTQIFENSKNKLNIAFGKDITGMPVLTDLTKMPHLLVAGATGTGKSVCLNVIINSLLFKVSPEIVRFIIIDPKRIELSVYKDIPHLLHPVVIQPKEATRVLKWAVEEMERRYMLLSEMGVRNIETYNRKIMKEKRPKDSDDPENVKESLPFIVLIIDELADLMMVSSKEVEESITRLAQMARAAGIHLIIATQRPSVDVLTGIIKANFPTRVSFQVSSKIDSRTILDTIGAENLLGEGDMLFMPPGVGKLTRIHGAYISEDAVKRVTDFLREQMQPDYNATIMEKVTRQEDSEDEDIELDEKYESAVELVIQTRHASISMVQRKLRVGYNRAARMIEVMEKQGIIGPSDGVRPREVYGRRENS